MHMMLDDGGIKLGAVVPDIKGVSVCAKVERLIEGKPIGKCSAWRAVA